MIQRVFKLYLVVILAISIQSCSSTDFEAEQSGDQEINQMIDGEFEESGDDSFSDDEESSSPDDSTESAEDEGDLEEALDSGETDIADDSSSEEFDDESFDDDSGEEMTDQEIEDSPGFDEELDQGNNVAENEDFDDSVQEPKEIDEPVNELSDQNSEIPANPEPIEDVPVENGFANTMLISNIRFQDNTDGGTVLIEADGPIQYQLRENPSKNQFIIEIANAKLKKDLTYPYLMKDFPQSQFGALNAYEEGGVVRVVLQMKQNTRPSIQAEGNALVVLPEGGVSIAANNNLDSENVEQPEPPSPVDQTQSNPPEETSYAPVTPKGDPRILNAQNLNDFLLGGGQFYGRPISFQVKDANVTDVINFISEESGANIVVANQVQGQISMKLRQVPWDQALVILMKSNSLGYVRQGNIIRITTLTELKKETELAKSIVESRKVLAPLKVKVLYVSFAKADDLDKQLKPFLTKTRGHISIDNRTNALVITDTDEVINKLTKLVKQLDVPPQQVMIEGKVIEASEDFKSAIGVRWGFSGGSLNLGTNSDNQPINLQPNINSQPISLASETIGNFGVRIGQLDFFGSLDAFLSLAEADNLVKIISSPRIVTINKEASEIKQKGEAVSISTTILDGVRTKTVVRDPVELKLSVTPQITNNGSIIMEVNVVRQFVGPIEDEETKARAINSREAKTKVMVKNGQTAVIGGIYQSDSTKGERGVPLLKDIPVLGWMFKYKSREEFKNELLIFLTPRILNNAKMGG